MNKQIHMFGKIVLLLSVAFLGYTLKQNNSYKLKYKKNLQIYLSQTALEIEEKHIEKSYNIITNLILYAPVGLFPTMELITVISGFSILFVNFILNFRMVYGELEEKFFLMTIVGFGVLLCGLKGKKKN